MTTTPDNEIMEVSELPLTAKKIERNQYLNDAIEARERANLTTALEMFDWVVIWDREQISREYTDERALTSLMHTLGHRRITLTHLGNDATSEEEKKTYYQRAYNDAQESYDLVDNGHVQIPAGDIAIAGVHLANAILSLTEYLDEPKRTNELKKALNIIDNAIDEISGSEAHKAWPIHTKCKILIKLRRHRAAYKTAAEGLQHIWNGYDIETKNGTDKDGLHKIYVWQTGLYLSMADVCIASNYPLLAKVHLLAVIAMEDLDDNLGERIKEARTRLAKLENM